MLEPRSQHQNIGVAPITHWRKVVIKRRIFSFKRSSHFKRRDAIEEKLCLIQLSAFDVRNFYIVPATPLS